MLKRDVVLPPEHLFPTDEWRVVEAAYTDAYHARAETVLALSNGYIGIRGTYDEGRPSFAAGTFVNGFHETWPILHAEPAYGLARTGQTIVNVPDATGIVLYVDDEPLFLPTARLREYERVLDMRAGTLSRDLVWSTASGKHVRVRSCRVVSLHDRHLVAMRYEVTMLDHAAPVVIASQLLNRQDDGSQQGEGGEDPRLAKVLGHRVLNCEVRERDGLRFLLGYRTAQSGMTLGVGVDHVIETDTPYDTAVSLGDDRGEALVKAHAVPCVPIVVTKYAAYQSSRAAPPRELVARCGWTLDRAVRDGFDSVLDNQRASLDRFWDRADVRVDAEVRPVRLQQAIRWNVFQIGQATWRAEGSGVPAKGLTSQAYDGHYFWDTETYVLPFLTYTQPRIARNLLRFRYAMLDRARRRARDLSQRGALFPWRTINGDEASANFQAGTAQYHINADIAHAVRRYMDVRGDPAFAVELGAELLVETARLWEDLGFYGDDGSFHIHGVTGPDEYTTVVNDNAYTNLMARENLDAAVAVVRQMREESPRAYDGFVATVGLRDDEVESWERAAAAMYVPYDERRGIHPQDGVFLEREVWDLANTPREQFPLLLHHHPLVIYRFQVLKQADIVLAMFLLGDHFSDEQKRRNFDYYDALTTGDSSLSACVQSIMAAEVGHAEMAMQYFTYALLMDLGDVAGNSSDGIHIASAAGVWAALVQGFGGMRDYDGRLSFSPRLPAAWVSLSFSLRFRNRQLRIEQRHDRQSYLVESGEALEITIDGKPQLLEPGMPFVVSR